MPPTHSLPSRGKSGLRTPSPHHSSLTSTRILSSTLGFLSPLLVLCAALTRRLPPSRPAAPTAPPPLTACILPKRFRENDSSPISPVVQRPRLLVLPQQLRPNQGSGSESTHPLRVPSAQESYLCPERGGGGGRVVSVRGAVGSHWCLLRHDCLLTLQLRESRLPCWPPS